MERIEPNLSGLDCRSIYRDIMAGFGATGFTRERALEDRLTRLLATIPMEVQREGLSIAALQASLRGRRRWFAAAAVFQHPSGTPYKIPPSTLM